MCVCILQDMESVDPRGRTPLELAVCLGHVESTRVLLRHNADPTRCSTRGWTGESQPPGKEGTGLVDQNVL